MSYTNELTRADDMLRYFKRMPESIFNVSESQTELIKKYWSELHSYDSEHEYTFINNFTQIRKERR